MRSISLDIKWQRLVRKKTRIVVAFPVGDGCSCACNGRLGAHPLEDVHDQDWVVRSGCDEILIIEILERWAPIPP